MSSPLPFTTPRDLGTFGVRDGGSDPVTILFIIPFLWLGGVGIRNRQRLIIKPIFWLGGILVWDLIGCIFVPVFRLI